MSSNAQKLLILLSLIALLGLILGFIFALKKRVKKHYRLKQIITQKTSEQRQIALEAILKRVTNIALDNDEFKTIAHQLTALYKTFIYQFKKLRMLAPRFINALNNSRFFTKLVQPVQQNFIQLDHQISKLENTFNELSRQVIAQDQLLQAEFYFYQKKLRMIVNIYNERKILYELIANPIDNFHKAISHLEKTFEQVIDKGNSLEAEIIIQRYICKVLAFAKIIDYGPALATQIKIQIPVVIAQLAKIHGRRQMAIKKSEPLTFNPRLDVINKYFQQAQKAFLKLDIDKTMTKVKLTLIAIAQYENKHNLEHKARTTFAKIAGDIIIEGERASKSWAQLQLEFNSYASSGKTISVALFNKYNNAKVAFNQFQDEMNRYQNLSGQPLSYMTRLHQGTSLLESLKRAMVTCNDFVTTWSALNHHNTNAKSKFFHANAVFTSIVSAAKEKGLTLTSSDRYKIEKITATSAVLAKILQGMITPQIETKVARLLTQVAQLYALLTSKMQLVFHIDNMIHESAPHRAHNPRLNARLQMAETKYLTGDYATSLNEIINCLRDSNLYT